MFKMKRTQEKGNFTGVCNGHFFRLEVNDSGQKRTLHTTVYYKQARAGHLDA